MLSKTTEIYATHGLPLPCDIYADSDYPPDAPVFLYFHPGGLVDWGRDCIAPWLVQACWKRKWPLISADFRQMPQVGQRGLVEDAKAAYLFARRWEVEKGGERRVIVGGASGGFFVASLIAHHAHPPPAALFSISGIATFRHAFFTSSTLNYAPGFDNISMDHFIAMPLWLGQTPINSPTSFELARLLPSGLRNPDYAQREEVVRAKPHRGTLYEYYTYKNAWPDLVGEVDLGYEWAREPEEAAARVAAWPRTVVFHGDDDEDVPLGVSRLMEEGLGGDKVRIVVARGMGHLFELMRYLEEDGPGMEAVREAMRCLDEAVIIE